LDCLSLLRNHRWYLDYATGLSITTETQTHSTTANTTSSPLLAPLIPVSHTQSRYYKGSHQQSPSALLFHTTNNHPRGTKASLTIIRQDAAAQHIQRELSPCLTPPLPHWDSIPTRPLVTVHTDADCVLHSIIVWHRPLHHPSIPQVLCLPRKGDCRNSSS
jgi:hypothetical protein